MAKKTRIQHLDPSCLDAGDDEIETARILSTFGPLSKRPPKKKLKKGLVGYCSIFQDKVGKDVDGAQVLTPGWELTGSANPGPYNFKVLSRTRAKNQWHLVNLGKVLADIGRNDLRQKLDGDWMPEDFPSGVGSSQGKFSRFATDIFFAAGRILLGLSESTPMDVSNMRVFSSKNMKQWECHWCHDDHVSVTTETVASKLHLNQLAAYGQCRR